MTTVGSAADAERLARTLVERRLAACVSTLPGVRSLYEWKGQIETAEEHLLIVKTSAEGLAALEAALPALHPYEVPEILSLAAGSSPAYATWVAEIIAAGRVL